MTTRCIFHSKGHTHIAHRTFSKWLQNHKFTKKIAGKINFPTQNASGSKDPYIWNKVHHA